jgi:hypothetical protein
MDECARRLCFLLQFLAASAEEQVAFSGDLLPGDAYVLAGAGADDDRRYELYWAERRGNPLSLLYGQFQEYAAVFSGLPDNTLPEDDTILEEILSLLNLMLFFRGNSGAFNRFWGAGSLREGKEWLLVRRLSRMALLKLGWPAALPETTFEEILYG